MTQNFSLSTSISKLNIVNDSYLIIIFGDKKDEYAVSDFTSKQKQEVQNGQDLLNEATSGIETGVVGKVGMALWTSPVVQNLVSKQLPNSVLNRINSSLYDIMADGKVSLVEVGEDLIGNCTNILDNMATDLGFPSPSGLYSAIMPGGTGVPSKDFANLFAKKAEEETKEILKKENQNLSEPEGVLKFKIVTKDSETWANDIPTRKTEDGLYLAQVIGNQNKTKNFSVSIINNSSRNTNMYQIKKQLEELRDRREAFNMYVCDADVRNIEFFKHCIFSNISIDTNGTNSLNADLSIVVIPEYTIKIDTNLQKTLKKYGGKGISNNKPGDVKNRVNNPSADNKEKTLLPQVKDFSKGDKRTLNTINTSKRNYQQFLDLYNHPPAILNLNKDALKSARQDYARLMSNEIATSTKKLQKIDPTYGWTQDKVFRLFNSGYDFTKMAK